MVSVYMVSVVEKRDISVERIIVGLNWNDLLKENDVNRLEATKTIFYLYKHSNKC